MRDNYLKAVNEMYRITDTLYRGRKAVFLIALIALLGMPTMAYAVTYDAQKDTTCERGYCITRVYLPDFMPSGLITALKKVDLTPAKPVINALLTKFEYRFDGDYMVFNGTVTDSVYWTFNLGNGYVIDPYWNYTTYAYGANNTFNLTAITGSDTSSDNYWRGIEFIPYINTTIVRAESYNVTSAFEDVRITNKSGTMICNYTSIVGNIANFNCNVTAGTAYYLVMEGNGWKFYFHCGTAGACAYPRNSTAPDFYVNSSIQGANLASPTRNNDILMGVHKVVSRNITATDYSVYYTANLFLNGNETNITLDDTSNLNMTGATNLTGSTVLIYVNGTVSANDTNSAENVTILPIGKWNITAWIGNASANSTVTLWATVFDTIYTRKTYCSDNYTLSTYNYTSIEDGSVFSYNEYCPNECDNVTYMCNPATYQQSMINIFIVIIVIVAVALVYRWSRR